MPLALELVEAEVALGLLAPTCSLAALTGCFFLVSSSESLLEDSIVLVGFYKKYSKRYEAYCLAHIEYRCDCKNLSII